MLYLNNLETLYHCTLNTFFMFILISHLFIEEATVTHFYTIGIFHLISQIFTLHDLYFYILYFHFNLRDLVQYYYLLMKLFTLILYYLYYLGYLSISVVIFINSVNFAYRVFVNSYFNFQIYQPIITMQTKVCIKKIFVAK
jgi:hypothetical protein